MVGVARQQIVERRSLVGVERGVERIERRTDIAHGLGPGGQRRLGQRQSVGRGGGRRRRVGADPFERVARRAQGLVAFVDNPAHKRSRLVRLTPEGEAAHDALFGRMIALCERLARGMDAAALRTTAETLGALRSKLQDL